MRLINVHSMKMEEHINPPPKYAILSHTWGQEEVTFADYMRDGLPRFDPSAFQKIQCTRKQAETDQIPFAWVDTCCIDKSSSAELSEAINSMFKWYQCATVCYVYLEDVETITGKAQEFCKSRWFGRGWTLQELLAPLSIEFYGRGWKYLGSKVDLLQHIASASGVFEIVLQKPYLLHATSIAARMSWASDRRTTREEDEAYSLLGIFNVHMPLLYGEGRQKAFLRLQEEVIKTSDDESLFAWRTRFRSSILAYSPSCFKGMTDVVPLKFDPDVSTENGIREPFSLTNRGLKIELPLINSTETQEVSYGVLACYRVSDPEYYLALPLRSNAIDDKNLFKITPKDSSYLEDFKVRKASISRQSFRKIYISESMDMSPTNFFSCIIETDAQFKLTPLFNLSFTQWDDFMPTLKRAVATTLLPDQTNVIIRFTVSLISDLRITFLGIIKWDLKINKTSIHAIVKRSRSWLKDNPETTGDIYVRSMTSTSTPPPTSHDTQGLGMCWRTQHDNIVLVSVVCERKHGIKIRAKTFDRSSYYYTRLKPLIDKSPFILKEYMPEALNRLW